jgi:hypothetical protein
VYGSIEHTTQAALPDACHRHEKRADDDDPAVAGILDVKPLAENSDRQPNGLGGDLAQIAWIRLTLLAPALARSTAAHLVLSASQQDLASYFGLLAARR